MKFRVLAALAAVGILLSACAGSVTAPVVVQALPAGQQSQLISDVAGEAAPGVVMLPADIDRVVQSIKIELAGARPPLTTPPGAPADSATRLKIVFTRYDSGSAAARALLIGLGQIHLEGDVLFLGTNGDIIGRYKIVKTFALGGIAGAVTSMSDVEKGFESSVVDLVKKNHK